MANIVADDYLELESDMHWIMNRKFWTGLTAVYTLQMTVGISTGMAQLKNSIVDPSTWDNALRDVDNARLNIMDKHSPRAGRDFTKLYVVNNASERISVVVAYKEVSIPGESTLSSGSTGSRPQGWYSVEPGARVHIANVASRNFFIYAESATGAAFGGSTALPFSGRTLNAANVDMGGHHLESYDYRFQQSPGQIQARVQNQRQRQAQQQKQLQQPQAQNGHPQQPEITLSNLSTEEQLALVLIAGVAQAIDQNKGSPGYSTREHAATSLAPPAGTENFNERLGIWYTVVSRSNQTLGARLSRDPLPGSPAATVPFEIGDEIYALDNDLLRDIDELNRHHSQTTVSFVNVRNGRKEFRSLWLPPLNR